MAQAIPMDVNVGDLICTTFTSGVFKVTKTYEKPRTNGIPEKWVTCKKVFWKNGNPIKNTYPMDVRISECKSVKETLKQQIEKMHKKFQKELTALNEILDNLP